MLFLHTLMTFAENLEALFLQLLLPGPHLVWMHLLLLGDLRYGLHALQRFQRNAKLEFWCVLRLFFVMGLYLLGPFYTPFCTLASGTVFGDHYKPHRSAL